MLKAKAEYDDSDFKQLKEDMMSEISDMMHDIADEIFAESQKLVSQRALDTGTLKKSGNVVIQGDYYIMVGYNTGYAQPVHDGFPAHEQSVRSHDRLMKSGKTVEVRAHSRSVKERQGTFYLDDAVDSVMAKQPKEVQDMIKISRYEGDFVG